ncbi:MAG: hypothetical protein M3186_04850 [Actinomycetota bacterium]|nr:hypothetical protein [Actinomycetota bacterium]
MALESVADELYSLPRDEFTAARNAAAARAREQGHRELADQIRALRRPSTAAWLANLLAREQPDEVRALVELGDGLRQAQHRLQGEALRRLSQQRHELVHALVQQAQALARTAGHPAGAAVTRELVNTFTAAVNSAAAAQALAAGRLTTALDPADAAAELFAGAGAIDRHPRDTADRADQVGGPDERLYQDLERFRAEAAEAGTTRDEAQRALAAADRAADDAATALQQLRARLDAAEQAEHEARRRAHAAQRHFETADCEAREAQRRVRDLERRLAAHQGG